LPVDSIPRRQIAGRLAQCPTLFGSGESRLESRGHGKRDFVLHNEDIGQLTIITLRPNMRAGFRINKL
jgi:hypothetical protein